MNFTQSIVHSADKNAQEFASNGCLWTSDQSPQGLAQMEALSSWVTGMNGSPCSVQEKHAELMCA